MELGYFDGHPAERIAGDESGTAMKRSRGASDLHLRSGRSTPLMHRKGYYEGGILRVLPDLEENGRKTLSLNPQV